MLVCGNVFSRVWHFLDFFADLFAAPNSAMGLYGMLKWNVYVRNS